MVGALVVNRRAAGAFADRTVELLRTFAAQSALAIQNARLFQEIEDKSRQLEVANQHKSEFLASMSHELRTPLNAIIGFSEVMLERMFGDVNAKQEEYLNDILSSGRHLLSLINDILDLAKIEAGRMELEAADFHLPAGHRQRARSWSASGRCGAGIALERTVDPRLGEVKGDERKIKQVLLNLLSNAVKFTPEGGRIEVRAGAGRRRRRDLGDRHRGRHRARGPRGGLRGVPPGGHGLRTQARGHRARAWPWPASSSSCTAARSGSKSQVGQGATFTFTIPVTPWQAS